MLKELVATLYNLGTVEVSMSALASLPVANAIEVAQAEIPASCVLSGYQVNKEKGISIVSFHDNNSFTDYVVTVDTDSGKVLGVEVKGAKFISGGNVAKSVEEIRELVLKEYPTARTIAVETTKEGSNILYVVNFITDKFRGEAEMHPATGVFGERSLIYF